MISQRIPKHTSKCAFCGPSGKTGWGQGNLLLFAQRKFQTNSGALKREALSLSPHSWGTIGMLILTAPKPENVSQGLFFCSYPPLFYASFLVLAQASSHSELKSCIEKQLEVGIMLKPHVWLISTLFSFRSSEWVPLVSDLHSYRVYSVLYCEIKHCQSTIIYKCIYLHVDYCSIFTFHVYLTLDCTQWDKVDYSELYFALHVQCWSIAFTDCGEQRLRSSLCTCWLHYSSHTHTHSHTHTLTHTHTERERASGRKPQPQSLFKNHLSACLSRSVSKVCMIDVLSAAQMSDRRKIIVMTQLLRGHLFPVKLLLWQLTRFIASQEIRKLI